MFTLLISHTKFSLSRQKVMDICESTYTENMNIFSIEDYFVFQDD